ncbi:MAG: CAP domain-containing protein [Treponema sp.]|nr:CAP domain-containing protein [Treponema sp.]
MKTIRYLFILLFCTVLLAGCTQAPEVSPAISEEIIQEINFARTQPKQYVTQRLSIIDTSKKSESYKQALDEVIDQMTRMKNPLPELTMADGLYKCAKEWVDVSGPQGIVGHDTNLGTRFQKYCKYTTVGENCSYGYSTAKEIVAELLIDDGVETRGHRQNILASAFTHAGAAVGSHKKYKTMCCIDFASGYKEK